MALFINSRSRYSREELLHMLLMLNSKWELALKNYAKEFDLPDYFNESKTTLVSTLPEDATGQQIIGRINQLVDDLRNLISDAERLRKRNAIKEERRLKQCEQVRANIDRSNARTSKEAEDGKTLSAVQAGKVVKRQPTSKQIASLKHKRDNQRRVAKNIEDFVYSVSSNENQLTVKKEGGITRYCNCKMSSQAIANLEGEMSRRYKEHGVIVKVQLAYKDVYEVEVECREFSP